MKAIEFRVAEPAKFVKLFNAHCVHKKQISSTDDTHLQIQKCSLLNFFIRVNQCNQW
jgi:hypothetical protein